MSDKLRRAFNLFRMQFWDETALKKPRRWAIRITKYPTRWAYAISQWDTQIFSKNFAPRRKRGRPQQRWEYDLTNFAKFHGYNDWMTFAEMNLRNWPALEQDFVNFDLYDN